MRPRGSPIHPTIVRGRMQTFHGKKNGITACLVHCKGTNWGNNEILHEIDVEMMLEVIVLRKKETMNGF